MFEMIGFDGDYHISQEELFQSLELVASKAMTKLSTKQIERMVVQFVHELNKKGFKDKKQGFISVQEFHSVFEKRAKKVMRKGSTSATNVTADAFAP